MQRPNDAVCVIIGYRLSTESVDNFGAAVTVGKSPTPETPSVPCTVLREGLVCQYTDFQCLLLCQHRR